MRRLVLIVALLVGLVAPATLTATSASAANGTPGCATKAEYAKVKKGMSPAKVKKIFGTNGKVTYSYIGSYVFSLSREYKPCSPFNEMSSVSVDFDKKKRKAPWKVSGKSAYWIENFDW